MSRLTCLFYENYSYSYEQNNFVFLKGSQLPMHKLVYHVTHMVWKIWGDIIFIVSMLVVVLCFIQSLHINMIWSSHKYMFSNKLATSEIVIYVFI